MPRILKFILSKLRLRSQWILCISLTQLIPGIAFGAAVEENPALPPIASRKITPIVSVSFDISISENLIAGQPKKKAAWDKACATLANAFHEGGSLWESSPGTSSLCKIANRTVAVAGAPKAPVAGGSANTFRVKVEVRGTSETIDFVLTLPAAGKAPAIPATIVSIPLTEWSSEFLSDQEFATLIAYAMLDATPFLGRLNRAALSLKTGELRLAEYTQKKFKTRKFDQIDPLPGLSFYRLQRDQDSGRFFAAHCGDAKLIKIEKIKSTSGIGAAARSGFMPTARYSMDKKLIGYGADADRIWFHSADGAGGQKDKLTAAISEAHQRLVSAARSGLLKNLFSKGYDSISDLMFQTAASGYFGLRYGKQLLTGDLLLERASMYGLLVEVRSGPLNGLKFYYDKFPKTSGESNGSTLGLEWSRLVLGKSFAFKIPLLINRVELTPKLGRYFLQSMMPIDTADNGDVISTQEFNVRNQPSFSLEVAAERASKNYTARLWYATDRAIAFLPIVGSSAVSAERFGADLFLNSGLNFQTFGIDYVLNILVFGSYENLALVDLKAGDLQAGEISVSGIQLRSAYSGLGIVINW